MKPHLSLRSTLLLFLFILGSAADGSWRSVQLLAAPATVTLYGTVRNSGGEVLPDTEVRAWPVGQPDLFSGTVTNQDGQYALDLAADLRYDLRVIPPPESDFGSVYVPGLYADQSQKLDFVLVPMNEKSLSGRIVDQFGTPLPFQKIKLLTSGREVVATTNEDGEFWLTVTGGYYLLEISFLKPAAVEGFRDMPGWYSMNGGVTLSESTYLPIQLPLSRLTVRVEDPQGTPVPNSEVSAQAHSRLMQIGPFTLDVFSSYVQSNTNPRTDGDGLASFWLFPDSYKISAFPPAGSTLRTAASQIEFAGESSATIVLVEPVTFAGRIVDQFGAPLPSQRIRLSSSTPELAETTTNANGEFAVSVAPGPFSLQISFNRLSWPGVERFRNLPTQYLISGAITLTESVFVPIQLPLQRLTVRVEDPNGDHVQGAQLFTSSPSPRLPLGPFNPEWACWYESKDSSARTDANGLVGLWLFPATYRITASAPSGSLFRSTTTDVVFEGESSTVIILTEPIAFRGRIVDQFGVPLPSQTVRLISQASSEQFLMTTDGNGEFGASVTPGLFSLQISFLKRSFPGVERFRNMPSQYLIEGRNLSITEDVFLDTQLPLERLRVLVQDPNGIPVQGAQLSTNTPSPRRPLGPFNPEWSSSYQTNDSGARTDANGAADLWLFPAAYLMQFAPPAGTRFIPVSIPDVQASEGTCVVVLNYMPPPPPIPTACMKPLPAQQCAGESFTLDATCSTDPEGLPLSYTWLAPFGNSTGPTRSLSLEEGIYDIRLIVRNSLGGAGSASVTITVGDQQAPQLSVSPAAIAVDPEGPAGAHVDLGTAFSVSVSDNCDCGYHLTTTPGSGLFSVGETTITYTATDCDGNSTTRTATVTVRPFDTTPPVISAVITGTQGNNGWYTSDVGIVWSVQDSESEISSHSGCDPIAISSDRTEIAYTCSAVSAGGASSATVVVKRDATPPVVSISCPPDGSEYLYGEQIIAAWDVRDNLSGVASVVPTVENGGAIGTTAVGPNQFAVQAWDFAGNSTRRSTAYTVLSRLETIDRVAEILDHLGPLSPQDEQKVEKAVRALEMAEDVKYWSTELQLSEQGQIVFELCKNSIGYLLALTDSADVRRAIDLLVELTRYLAVDELERAVGSNGDPADIAKAWESLSEGDAARERGDIQTAIQNYKNAWQFALRAQDE